MNTPVERLHGVRRVAFLAMVVGAIGIAAAYASAFLATPLASIGPWIMAVALPVCLVGVMTLGAVRRGQRLGKLMAPFAVVFVLVAGGFVVALLMPVDVASAPLFLGLPYRAAVILYGVGLLPLFVLPIAYALTFDSFTLSDADIAAVRAAKAQERPEHAGRIDA